MAAGKFPHVAVDQIEAGGKDDIDAHKHQDELGVGIQPAHPGQPDGEEKNEGGKKSRRMAVHGILRALHLGPAGHAEDPGGPKGQDEHQDPEGDQVPEGGGEIGGGKDFDKP